MSGIGLMPFGQTILKRVVLSSLYALSITNLPEKRP
jgi:hypothetical protein